jgi:hypothetical protein
MPEVQRVGIRTPEEESARRVLTADDCSHQRDCALAAGACFPGMGVEPGAKDLF